MLLYFSLSDLIISYRTHWKSWRWLLTWWRILHLFLPQKHTIQLSAEQKNTSDGIKTPLQLTRKLYFLKQIRRFGRSQLPDPQIHRHTVWFWTNEQSQVRTPHVLSSCCFCITYAISCPYCLCNCTNLYSWVQIWELWKMLQLWILSKFTDCFRLHHLS